MHVCMYACMYVCYVMLCINRYMNDGSEHHAYHADGGSEARCGARRVLAVLLYLNDVSVGGDTAFLFQALSVRPVCGRLVIFPTSFMHVHAGVRPVSNPKYLITNFINIV
jgi:hypothetical protein